ncbi:MAG: hypothetical protein ABFS34_08200 [Gemmatimonadota bacterium]
MSAPRLGPRGPRRLASTSLVTLALGLAACGDSGPAAPPGPQAGQLSVVLSAPTGAPSALLLRISGPGPMTAVTPGGPDQTAFAQGEGEAVITAAVFGTLPDGVAVLRFRVPDVARADGYLATLLQASDAAYAPLSASAYAVSVE